MMTSWNGIGTAPVLQFAGLFQSPPLGLIHRCVRSVGPGGPGGGVCKSTVNARFADDVAGPLGPDTVAVMTSVPGAKALPDNVRPDRKLAAGIVMLVPRKIIAIAIGDRFALRKPRYLDRHQSFVGRNGDAKGNSRRLSIRRPEKNRGVLVVADRQRSNGGRNRGRTRGLNRDSEACSKP